MVESHKLDGLLNLTPEELVKMREDAEATGYNGGWALGQIDQALALKRKIAQQPNPRLSSKISLCHINGRSPRGAGYVDALMRNRMGDRWGKRR